MNNKLPPQNLDAEQSVLGAMLISKTALHKSRNLLIKEDFYTEQNQVVFEAILQLDDKHIVPDLVTVAEKLTDKVEPFIISGLISSVATGENCEYHAHIVKEKAVARDLIRLQTITGEKAYDTDDIFGLLNEIRAGTNDILQKGITKEGFDLGRESIKVLEKMGEDKGKEAEFPLGLEGLDRMIRLERTDVMIIAGESSFGKTSLATNIALNQTQKVLICSWEMSKEQLIKRMISTVGLINSNRTRLSCLDATDWQSATNAVKVLQNKNIILEHASNLRQVLEFIIRYSPDMVIIDHLQLIQSLNPVGSRAAIVGELSRQVKQIATDNNVAMILLSQLHRVADSKEPTLSRLKESGDVENNCQICLLLWWEWKSNNNANRNKQKIIVAKNANGETGYCEVSWKPEYFKYNNLEEEI